jgi:C_GCAxxG_C_C family probable redox protein
MEENKMVGNQERQELLDKIEREAAQYERDLHACGRSALMALALNMNLANANCIDAVLRAAIPLSGGIAGTRNHCGALLAGIMAIGLAQVTGSPREDAVGERKAAMAASKRLYRRFEKELGHVRCFDIRDVGLGRSFDTSDPGEQKRFEEAGGFVFCSSVVGKAARMAAEIILQSR